MRSVTVKRSPCWQKPKRYMSSTSHTAHQQPPASTKVTMEVDPEHISRLHVALWRIESFFHNPWNWNEENCKKFQQLNERELGYLEKDVVGKWITQQEQQKFDNGTYELKWNKDPSWLGKGVK